MVAQFGSAGLIASINPPRAALESVENSAAANSLIVDADFASETASLTRNQILSSAAQNTLALANQQPQAALQLLG